jgi:aspartate ammonia-lyase
VREVALERTRLSASELDTVLDPASMTEPGLSSGVSLG